MNSGCHRIGYRAAPSMRAAKYFGNGCVRIRREMNYLQSHCTGIRPTRGKCCRAHFRPSLELDGAFALFAADILTAKQFSAKCDPKLLSGPKARGRYHGTALRTGFVSIARIGEFEFEMKNNFVCHYFDFLCSNPGTFARLSMRSLTG